MPLQRLIKGKSRYLLLLGILAALSYTLGSWNGRPIDRVSAKPDDKSILYYHCPMHPGFQSDRPGTAPCCGMELEPVYAGGGGTSRAKQSLPPGFLQISSHIQQAIGVRTAVVEKTSTEQTLRLLGRVAADELRVYKIRAAVDGWIQTMYPITVGQMVDKGQPLASFYSPDFLGPEQNYLIALVNEEKKIFPDQWRTVQSYEDTLRGFGMDTTQLEEIRKTRKISRDILMRAPVRGFVLQRQVSPGYRFLKGEELYRIAELDRLWIYADLFEGESRYVRAGATAKVIHSQLGKQFSARVSDVLPQFDAVTRTVKIRLDVDNPDYTLLPDMFVDVEFPLNFPPSLTVPSEAVLYSGTQKTVFVERGNDCFEPRRVETGRRMNNRIEIVKGLTEGEQIVVSGNFLLDSESRLQGLASGYAGNEAVDPVCGMKVDPAKKTTLKSVAGNQAYYFCSRMCKDAFDAEPNQYLLKSKDMEASVAKHQEELARKTAKPEQSLLEDKGTGPPMKTKTAGASMNAAKDPVCGMTVVREQSGALASEYKGRTYYFCSSSCKKKFDQGPGQYDLSSSDTHE